jgi:hypothetical protein
VDSYDDFQTLKNTVSANVDRLMKHAWGSVNKSKLARVAAVVDPLTGDVLEKAGQGTYDRLKKPDADVGLSLLRRIAAAFGLQPWQLMIPELDPEHPPNCLPMSPLAASAAQALDQIEDEELRRKLHAMIEQLALKNPAAAPTEPSPAPKPEPHRHR